MAIERGKSPMAAKIRRVDLYADDFLTGTPMLDDTEFGLYARACLLIYATGGPVTVEHLKAVSKSHGHTFKRCLRRLTTLGKLIHENGKVTNKRCQKELERARQRIANRKAKPEEQRTWYHDYLFSAEWQSRRLDVLNRCGGVCEHCHSQPATQVHHLTYTRVGHELLDDLLGLCRDCHEQVHGIALQ